MSRREKLLNYYGNSYYTTTPQNRLIQQQLVCIGKRISREALPMASTPSSFEGYDWPKLGSKK